MRTFPAFLLMAAAMTVPVAPIHADLITTLDFSDSIWDVQVTETTAGIAHAGAGFAGGLLTSRRTTSVAGGSVLVTATLTGTISTLGFQDITLEFDADTSSNLEHNAGSFGDASGDAFGITSTDGVSFLTPGSGAAFRTQLNTDQTWTPTNATTFGQDLSFSGTVDNGVISDLQIQLQVDGSNEIIRLNNFQLMGDPFVATVPEPSSVMLLLLCTTGLILRRKFGGHECELKTAGRCR